MKQEITEEDKKRTEDKFRDFDNLIRLNKPFFYKLKEDPTLFAYYFFRDSSNNPFKVYPFQDLLLNDKARRILLAISRQTGKSTSAGIIAFQFAFFHNQCTVVVISNTKPQSIEFIKKIKDLIRSSDKYPFFKIVIKEKESKSEITLKNYKSNTESRIISVPATDAARGYAADLVIVDEAAFIENGDYIFNQVIEPMTQATNGKIMLLSTPNGKRGFFWECYNSKFWQVYQFDWRANPKKTEEEMEEKRIRMTAMEFKSEYEAQFVASQAAYFNPDDIKHCISKNAGLGVKGESGIVVGVDFGKINDQAIIMIGKIDRLKEDYTITVLKRIVKPLGTDYSSIIGELKTINTNYKPSLMVLDATGVGEAPSDVLKESGAIVEPFKFSIQSKADIFSNLKIHLEQRKVLIPDEKELINQLELFEYEYTSSGNIKLHAPEGGHDDECDALALMVWGLSRRYVPVSLTVIPNEPIKNNKIDKKGKNFVFNEEKKEYEWI
jgi:phage terminase large subunit-like protein